MQTPSALCSRCKHSTTACQMWRVCHSGGFSQRRLSAIFGSELESWTRSNVHSVRPFHKDNPHRRLDLQLSWWWNQRLCWEIQYSYEDGGDRLLFLICRWKQTKKGIKDKRSKIIKAQQSWTFLKKIWFLYGWLLDDYLTHCCVCLYLFLLPNGVLPKEYLQGHEDQRLLDIQLGWVKKWPGLVLMWSKTMEINAIA